MKKQFVMAIPILPGKTPQLKKFVKELKTTYYPQYAESRKKLNVWERTYFQSTPQGDLVIVTLEGKDPENALKEFSKGTDAFTKWFAKEAKEIHGIDLLSAPPGQVSELLIDSQETVLQN